MGSKRMGKKSKRPSGHNFLISIEEGRDRAIRGKIHP